MRIFLITILAALTFTACNQNATEKADNNVEISNAIDTNTNTSGVLVEDAPKFEFEKEVFDFGNIEEGESVQTSFKFKNVGNTPLIITNATATCGCTVPEYPKTPIKPGESGVITVIFNSQGKMDVQDKVVTITSNANPAAPALHLVGVVKAKK